MDNVGYDGGAFGLFLFVVFVFGILFRILSEANIGGHKVIVRDSPEPEPEPPKPKPKPPKPKPKPKPELLTDQSIKDDVIGCLRSLGYKKKESTDVVNTIADRIAYTDVEVLLKDILSGKR